MEKYGDDQNVGQQVTVVTGPNNGKSGIVKKAADGVLTIRTIGGTEIVVDEDQIRLGAPQGIKGS